MRVLYACADQLILVNYEEQAMSARESMNLEDLQQQVKQLAQTQAKQSDALARVELMLQKLMDHQGLERDE